MHRAAVTFNNGYIQPDATQHYKATLTVASVEFDRHAFDEYTH